MRGFSSRTRKNSSARAGLQAMLRARNAAAATNAAASRDKKRRARLGSRGAAPRIRSNLGAAHSQLDGGDDQGDSDGYSYPCLSAGKKSTGVDQMPHAGCG